MASSVLSLARDGGAEPRALVGAVPTLAEVVAASTGPIHKPETVNYRSGAPEPGGLFDADRFGAFDPDGPTAPDREAATPPLPAGHLVLAAPVLHPLLVHRSAHRVAEAAGVSVAELTAIASGDESQPMDAVHAIAARAPHLVLVALPVLPIAHRPMRRTGERWAIAAINDLYRRVINRSNRLARLVELRAPEIIVRNEGRMLHGAVAALMVNRELAEPVCATDAAPLPSLYDGFVAHGGWDAVFEVDARAALDPGALAGPLPYRWRAALDHLRALGIELRVRGGGAPRPAASAGFVPVPF